MNDEKCKWKYEDIDDFYETECGEAHCFIEAGLEENKYKYCPYCGNIIANIALLDPEPDPRKRI